MSTHVRFVGILMAIVLLVAVVAAITGPEVYFVTLDDQGNSYYLPMNSEGTLGAPTLIGHLDTRYQNGAGIGNYLNNGNYGFVVGAGYTPLNPEDPIVPKEIYFYQKNGLGNDFLEPVRLSVSWESGDRPAGMPVGNFDGRVFDQNALDDFAMVRLGTSDVGLYLNQGNGVFVKSAELEYAASTGAFGADAADINHDGYADFVVVSPYEGYIYVSLQNEDGSFTSTPFPTQYGVGCYGVAAADFDGDHKVDLIVTSPSYGGLEFYKGDGLGGFIASPLFATDLVAPRSSVDNYLNPVTGYQDIVISNLAYQDPFAVIQGFNDGSGQFAFGDRIYVSGQGSGLTAINAPPVFQNEAPYAQITVLDNGIAIDPSVQRIKTGTTLEFSGINSGDPEEKPLASDMIWWFQDGDSTVTTTAETVTHTFNLPPGPSDVALTVTDNYGATDTQTVTIHVNYPPIAENDLYTTPKNVALTVPATGVLANDHDSPDDDPLTATLVSSTSHGTLTLNGDGSFEYTPVENFVGKDTFTYIANDKVEDSNIAEVTVEVTETPVWKVNIVPGAINLNSRGVFIAFIHIPKPYSANDVQPEVTCEGATAVRLIRHGKSARVFGAVFNTADLQNVKTGKRVELTVKGQVLYNNQLLPISGTDTVRIFTIKKWIKDDTEDYYKHTDKQLFEKFPGYRGDGRDWDWDSSGNEEHDH